MADLVSQIKGLDNVTYDLQDKVSTFGNENLFIGTKDWNGWYTNNSTLVTFNNDIANFAGNTSKSWICICSPCILFEDIKNNDLCFSMEVRSDDYESLPEAGYPSVQFYLKTQGPQATNYSTRAKTTPANTITPISNEWSRFSVSLKNITENSFTTTYNQNDAPWFALCLWVYQTKSVQFKNFKLERGNKPTDWSPSCYDLATYSDETIEFFQ